MIDNYDIWLAREEEMERKLSSRPLCSYCENHIQDDHYYEIEDKLFCPNCLEHFRKELDY